MKFSKVLMLLIIVTCVLKFTSSLAQTLTDCHTATNYYTKRILSLYEENKLDSLDIYIKKWDEFCEDNEELIRMKIIWAIKEGNFNENLFNDKIINLLIDYREKILIEQNIPNLNDFQKEYRKYIYSNEHFNRFTQSLASEIAGKISENNISSMFAEYYANKFDSFFIRLNEPVNQKSKLYSYYRYYLKNLRESYERYITIMTGYWFSTGDIKFYSHHPAIGFALGFKTKKNAFQIASSLRLLKGDNFYLWQRGQVNESYFINSISIALEQRRDIKQLKNSEFNVGFGFGIEHFSFHLPFPDQKIQSLQSFVVSFGLGYKYYWITNLSRFSEIQIVTNRYGKNEYAIELRFTYGFNLNKRKNDLMRLMQY